MANEEETLSRSYFTKKTEMMDAEILKDDVIVTKDKHGARGSIYSGIHYE